MLRLLDCTTAPGFFQLGSGDGIQILRLFEQCHFTPQRSLLSFNVSNTVSTTHMHLFQFELIKIQENKNVLASYISSAQEPSAAAVSA